MGLKGIVIAMGMVIIFSIAIVSFMVGFANDNETYIDVSDDPSISGLDTALGGAKTQIVTSADDAGEVLQETKIKSGDENVEGGGQFKNNPYTYYSYIKNVTSVGNEAIFGQDVNFLVIPTIILAMLSFIIGLYIWKTWKGGNPD